MLVKQELTMNLSMKCFPAQKRNYDIEILISKMPNADEKNHYLLIFNLALIISIYNHNYKFITQILIANLSNSKIGRKW